MPGFRSSPQHDDAARRPSERPPERIDLPPHLIPEQSSQKKNASRTAKLNIETMPSTEPVVTFSSRTSRTGMPQVWRAWPRGRADEGWRILGDTFLAIARLMSWVLTGLSRLLFTILRGIARGFGFVIGKLTGGRLRSQGTEAVGWVLLVAMVAATVASSGTISAWAKARFFPLHKLPVVAYVPPPSACTLPRAACAPPTRLLDGQPSMSASDILKVLTTYKSPSATAEFASALYDLGIAYGVNPAYALGFFVEESQCGTQGLAVNTQSIGNIRFTASNSPVHYNEFQGFRSYASWRDGAEDWYWLIRTYYLNQGARDVYDVTPIYAPSTDNNNPTQYADTVYGLVQEWGT